MTEVEPAIPLAVKGAAYSPGSLWRCHCDRQHRFGPYAAAHWSEDLEHECPCGTGRVFRKGVVISHRKPAK